MIEIFGRDIAAADDADGRDRRARADELDVERVPQRRFDVGVFRLEQQTDEAAIAVDEVVLVAEAVGLPFQLGRRPAAKAGS